MIVDIEEPPPTDLLLGVLRFGFAQRVDARLESQLSSGCRRHLSGPCSRVFIILTDSTLVSASDSQYQGRTSPTNARATSASSLIFSLSGV